jgi:hypothetical protein
MPTTTRRCDKCGRRRVIVMGSPITDRQVRAELGRDLYDWCLECARVRHPTFTPAPRKPWFVKYENAIR